MQPSPSRFLNLWSYPREGGVEKGFVKCENKNRMVELGKTPRCFLPHSGACSLPKHNSALQNASVSQNSRQARKRAAFILAVETGGGRWIPEIEAAWFTE